MDKLKGVSKGGWHPKNDPKFNNLNKDWKQGFGLRGDPQAKADAKAREEHVSAPLTTLRDPDAFGPPPKHTAYYGAGGSNPSSPARAKPAPGGWGAPVPKPEPRKTQEEIEAEEAAEEAAKPPPGPFQRDTTGLRTDHLPPPPKGRPLGDPSDLQPPSTPTRATAAAPRAPATPPRAPATPPRTQASKPAPPPRLPPRQNEYPTENTPAPPPPYNEAVQQPVAHDPVAANQDATQRLGAAGVSVPGFGIGSNPTPPESPQRNTNQVNELQARFARMKTGSTQNESPNQDQSQGTTWQQKQDALRTASNFRNDPSSISATDARSAASTANNFRERHGAQMASAAQTANGLANRFSGQAQSGQQGYAQASPPATPTSPVGKKAPPPPPPKKSALHGAAVAEHGDMAAPPPLPLTSKPKPM